MERMFIYAIGILFMALGLAIYKFKCYWLISGYNTASKEKRDNVDIKGLSRALSILCYIIGFTIIVIALLESYLPVLVSWVGMLMPFFVIGFVIYCKRFDNNKSTMAEKIGMSVILGIPLIISIIIFAGSTERNNVIINEESISIKGFYGVTLEKKDIEEVSIVKELPKVKTKYNGASIGSYKKGTFTLKNGERVKLFLESKEGPYLKIGSTSGDIYLNFKGNNQFNDIYNGIK